MTQQLVALPVKIAATASVSGSIDLRAYIWRGVHSPVAWDAARLTALSRITAGARSDGTVSPPASIAPPALATTLGGVTDAAGALVVFAVDAALQVSGQLTLFTGAVKDAAASIAETQLRSTNVATAAAVVQSADRFLWLVLEPR